MNIIIPVQAQVTIGSVKKPEPFSILEMDSKEGGIRLNQLDVPDKQSVTTKLNATSNKNLTKGLTIFNTAENKMQYWDGNKWAQVVSVAENETTDGLDGQFLMSKGADTYPEWTTLNVPVVEKGEFYLYSAVVKKDMVGVDLVFKENNYEPYPEDLLLNGPMSKEWHEIKGLEAKINIPDIPRKPGDPPGKIYTRLAIEMQTGAQMLCGPDIINFTVRDNTGSDKLVSHKDPSWISFGLGVFIGNDTEGYKLKQVRSYRLEGLAANSFATFTLIGAVDNLPAGEHNIKVAAKRRTHANFMEQLTASEIIMTVGKPAPGSGNYSNFMAQSFLRANIYVIYE